MPPPGGQNMGIMAVKTLGSMACTMASGTPLYAPPPPSSPQPLPP
eukprot:CAMPEP_0115704472 /NCGR_PEP_ID=MMETSP0272-20121206/69682_1 /TAXON_ID=71861 /ORGANISM="Scrippsiella trochoidea, Strain CCMP3099" /LENGTH=44 /DNA_ID= /DNA_START= /DNA_END= /DNA_ORIENTATION=